MGGANVCVFTWVVATIFIGVKTHKNTTVYADNRNCLEIFRILYAIYVVLSVSVCGANACVFT